MMMSLRRTWEIPTSDFNSEDADLGSNISRMIKELG